MDRNDNLYIVVVTSAVATREGGVDRNWLSARTFGFGSPVATREGGVDRNFVILKSLVFAFVSPPARVAG